jgi:hypothetical protein
LRKPCSPPARPDHNRAEDRDLDEAAWSIEARGEQHVPDDLIAIGRHEPDCALSVGCPQTFHEACHNPPVIAEGSEMKVAHGDRIVGALRPDVHDKAYAWMTHRSIPPEW